MTKYTNYDPQDLITMVDLNQGTTDNERRFGYVGGESGGDDGDDPGGFFFTWHDTLEETVASVDEDEIGGDGGLDRDYVIEFLRGYLPTTKAGKLMWDPAWAYGPPVFDE